MSGGHEEEPAFVAETLAWCNTKRVEKGLEPLAQMPKGRRDDGHSCPCGVAARLYVSSNSYVDGHPINDGDWGELPEPVREFVALFDNGHLPQYDINALAEL